MESIVEQILHHATENVRIDGCDAANGKARLELDLAQPGRENAHLHDRRDDVGDVSDQAAKLELAIELGISDVEHVAEQTDQPPASFERVVECFGELRIRVGPEAAAGEIDVRADDAGRVLHVVDEERRHLATKPLDVGEAIVLRFDREPIGAERDEVRDPKTEEHRIDGLRDEVIGPDAGTFEPRRRIGEAGQEDHRKELRRRLSLQALRGLDAGHTGHDDVQEHQIRRRLGCAKQRHLAGFGLDDLISALHEVRAKHSPVQSFVVDDQYARHDRPRSRASNGGPYCNAKTRDGPGRSPFLRIGRNGR